MRNSIKSARIPTRLVFLFRIGFDFAARQTCTLRKFILMIIRNLFFSVLSNNQIEYHWDDTRNHQELQNITTHYDFCSHESRRGNTIITWMIAICSWLIKKLLHLINIVSSWNLFEMKILILLLHCSHIELQTNLFIFNTLESNELHILNA